MRHAKSVFVISAATLAPALAMAILAPSTDVETMPQGGTLEIIGQAGVLGEWALTANLTAAERRGEYFGPLALKHVGLCARDGPEAIAGEITLYSTGASRLKASLKIAGVSCSFDATKSDVFIGTLRCSNGPDMPLRFQVK